MSAVLEALMREEQAELPVGYCLKCHKEVVAYGKLGTGSRDGLTLWHCLLCDEELLQEHGGIQFTPLDELQALGYQVVDPMEEPAGGSCGTGGGCGSGGGCHS